VEKIMYLNKLFLYKELDRLFIVFKILLYSNIWRNPMIQGIDGIIYTNGEDICPYCKEKDSSIDLLDKKEIESLGLSMDSAESILSNVEKKFNQIKEGFYNLEISTPDFGGFWFMNGYNKICSKCKGIWGLLSYFRIYNRNSIINRRSIKRIILKLIPPSNSFLFMNL
jgi:hypothetical protein